MVNEWVFCTLLIIKQVFLKTMMGSKVINLVSYKYSYLFIHNKQAEGVTQSVWVSPKKVRQWHYPTFFGDRQSRNKE